VFTIRAELGSDPMRNDQLRLTEDCGAIALVLQPSSGIKKRKENKEISSSSFSVFLIVKSKVFCDRVKVDRLTPTCIEWIRLV